jgi:hypothetical protein
VTVSFCVVVAVTVTVKSWLGAIGVITSGPSDVFEVLAEEGLAAGVGDEEIFGGGGGLAEEDGFAGASGAFDDGLGCLEDDRVGVGSAVAEDEGCIDIGEDEDGLGEGKGTTGVLGASGAFDEGLGCAVDDGTGIGNAAADDDGCAEDGIGFGEGDGTTGF